MASRLESALRRPQVTQPSEPTQIPNLPQQNSNAGFGGMLEGTDFTGGAPPPPRKPFGSFAPDPPPSAPSGAPQASEKAQGVATPASTWTAQFFEFVGLAFILVPPGLLGEAFLKGETVNWSVMIAIFVGYWTVGAFILVVGNKWPEWRPNNQAIATAIEAGARNIWVWLALLIVIAFGPALLVAALSRTATPVSVPNTQLIPTTSPATIQPEYLKDIAFGVDERMVDKPSMIGATPTLTTDRLRVFVDYSMYRNGWMPKIRVQIGEIKEPVAGQQIAIPFIYSVVGPGVHDLFWGNPSLRQIIYPPDLNDIIPVIPIRARLAIIGPSGEEQHYYFEMLRFDNNQSRRFGILRGPEQDWIADWKAGK